MCLVKRVGTKFGKKWIVICNSKKASPLCHSFSGLNEISFHERIQKVGDRSDIFEQSFDIVSVAPKYNKGNPSFFKTLPAKLHFFRLPWVHLDNHIMSILSVLFLSFALLLHSSREKADFNQFSKSLVANFFGNRQMGTERSRQKVKIWHSLSNLAPSNIYWRELFCVGETWESKDDDLISPTMTVCTIERNDFKRHENKPIALDKSERRYRRSFELQDER